MKWFESPTDLLPKLRQLQQVDSNYEQVKSEDSVVMFYGMGDPLNLTFEARVMIEDMLDDIPPREAQTLAEAAMAIVVGAKVRNFPELLLILPDRPQGSVVWANCEKSGWFRPGGVLGPFVCSDCGGLGWKPKENENRND